MGVALDEHQARLDTINSCRCGEKSRAEARGEEDDQRSELSYVDNPMVNASPIPIPPSAPRSSSAPRLELLGVPGVPDTLDPTILRPWFEARDEWVAGEEERLSREEEAQRAMSTPPSELFWQGTLDRDAGESSGRLVEIVDRAEDAPREVLVFIQL
jgi:hypothetical protein